MFNRMKEYWQRSTSKSRPEASSLGQEQEEPRDSKEASPVTTPSLKQIHLLSSAPHSVLGIPQHREILSVNEHFNDGTTMARALLPRDGSSLRKSFGEMDSVRTGSSLLLDDKTADKASEMSPSSSHSRRTSMSTVIIGPDEHDRFAGGIHDGETFTFGQRQASSTSSPVLTYLTLAHVPPSVFPGSTVESFDHDTSIQDQRQKRVRDVFDNAIKDFDDIRPQKKFRGQAVKNNSHTHEATSRSAAACSPSTSPIGKLNMGKQAANRRVRSHSDIRSVGHHNWRCGRRTWSAEDVLRVLRSGQETVEGSTDNTPPSSPLKASLPLVMHQRKYTLPLSKVPPPASDRKPLGNITGLFVPEFLQLPAPDIRPEVSPPTPGDWSGLSDAIQSDPSVDEPVRPIDFSDSSESKPVTHFQKTTNTWATFLPTVANDGKEGSILKDFVERSGVAQVLRGLDNDAKFMEDSLRQVKALKAKLQESQRLQYRTENFLNENMLIVSEAQKENMDENITRYLNEAKALQVAADRAEAEATEYRTKAKLLLDNLRIEVQLLIGEDDVGEE